MGSNSKTTNNNKKHNRKKIDKRFLSKNKTIKLYKEKVSKINLFKKDVEILTQKYNQVDIEKVEKFDDLPLSDRTKRGLKECGYFTPTQIQKETIMLSLLEHDVLGAAKTGSGKTLAFVIPLLERLYTSGWTILDGLGALIITPTRELAYQIFEVINKVGARHQFSVGLIIGGKDLAKERKLLDKCNIMICTPGRLLQHMDENPLFDSMNLKMLILDEADRILDLGFAKTMNAILENLPEERQTLLFSATQTKSVKDLARLSLKDPKYVSVDEHAKYTTPEALQQSFIECEAHDKMNLLWSFIKSHKKQKILVFMASCKQVKFTYESICRLRPGVSIMALYGSLHQLRRMQIYDEFCKKNHVVMFATDVASRGLDFPNVNWVVQLDCPEDVNTYIHRAGRTARYQKGGESLLVLLPSEKESMVKQLMERKIPIEEIKANPNKLQDIKRKLEAILMRDKNLKESGVRAFKAYLKNIFLMKDKSVFDVTQIDIHQYANSLGLDFVPRIRFLEKNIKDFKKISVIPTLVKKPESQESSDEESETVINSLHDGESAENYSQPDKECLKDSMLNCHTSDESEDDCLRLIEQHALPSETEQDSDDEHRKKKPLTKAALVKRALKKNTKLNTVVKFDEEGNPLCEVGGSLIPDSTAELKRGLLEDDFTIENARLLFEKENEIDKKLQREKIRIKHRTERLKEKEKRWLKNPADAPPTLEAAEDVSDKEELSDENIDPNNMSLSESEGEEDLSDEQHFEEKESDNSEEVLKEKINSQQELSLDENENSNLSSDSAELSDETNYDNEDTNVNVITAGMKRKKNMKNFKKKKLHSEEMSKSKKRKTERTIEDEEQLALHFLNM